MRNAMCSHILLLLVTHTMWYFLDTECSNTISTIILFVVVLYILVIVIVIVIFTVIKIEFEFAKEV